jgi:mono/diheme cytochrome c family protein
MKSALLLLLTLAVAPLAAQRQHAPQQAQTNDEMQPNTLPHMPAGMTVDMLQRGDSLFHGAAGCFACHGSEAEGLPAAGDGFTAGLSFVQPDWKAIQDLIAHGLSDAETRAPIRMPARGARGDLSDAAIRDLAAYVWAIAQVHGEPWPGGHTLHSLPPGATQGTAGLVERRGRQQARTLTGQTER